MAPAKKENQRKVAAPKTAPDTAKASDAPITEKAKRSKKPSTTVADNTKKQDVQPKKSRKRTADLQAEDGEPSASSDAPKAKKKAKTIAGEEQKLSKVDGSPIETAKTHPGGDTVEVEPTKGPKGKKGKVAKVEKVDEVPSEKEVKKPVPAVSKSKKTEKKEEGETSTGKAKKTTAKAVVVSKTPAEGVVEKLKKSKGASKQDEEPAKIAEGITSKSVDEEPSGVSLGAEDAKDVPSKEGKSRAKPKPKKGSELPLATSNDDRDPIEDSITVGISTPPKGRKTKEAQGSKGADESKKAKADKPGKEINEKAPKDLKGKSITKDEVSNAPSKSDLPEEDNESAQNNGEPTDTKKPTSRKRKSPADKDVERPNLVDQLAAGEVPNKKVKKSKTESSKAAAKVQDLLSSGLDAAAQGINTAKDYIGDLANSAQKSVMGDIAEVASGAVDLKNVEKKKASKAPVSKKGKGKAKDASSTPQREANGSLEADASTVIDEKEDTIVVAGQLSDENDDTGDEDLEEDDQTAALLKGFESSEDEDVPSGEGFVDGQKIPNLPAAAKKASNKLKKSGTGETGVGVIYIGRIPHGFFEHQMREYFSQFGNIQRLRLSRNRKTGKSKHYAFIEFTSEDVAKIVASTMDNYLMFGHILKCKLIPKEQVHENLWKGANKRFKAVPWSKIEGRKLEKGASREVWKKRVEREENKRAEKAEKLKEIGYDFDAGELKSVDSVPIQDSLAAIEDPGQDQEIIEQEKTVVVDVGDGGGTIVVSEEVSTKKVKRSSKEVEELDNDATNAVEGEITATKDAEKIVEEEISDIIKEAEEVSNDSTAPMKRGRMAKVPDVTEAGPSSAKPTKKATKEKVAKKEKTEKAPKEAKPAKAAKTEKAPKESKPAKKEKIEKAAKEDKPAKKPKKATS